VATAGGTMSRRLTAEKMGWVVPEGDEAALIAALAALLDSAELRRDFADRGREWAAAQSWDRVLAPLAEFLAAPRCDPHKHRYPPSSIPQPLAGGRFGLGGLRQLRSLLKRR
jgi:hypothetical protein